MKFHRRKSRSLLRYLMIGLLVLPATAESDDSNHSHANAKAPVNEEMAKTRHHATPKSPSQNTTTSVSTTVYSDGELTKLIENASSTYKKMSANPLFVEKVMAAKCMIIFPSITKVAAIAGGSHGDGIATCRGEKSGWTPITFLDFYGGSVGLQLGASETDAIILLSSKKARDDIEKGKLMFTGSFDYVVFDSESKMVHEDKVKDFYIFTSKKGILGEASLGGAYVAMDQEELNNFYRKEISFVELSKITYMPGENKLINDFYLILP